MRVLSICVYLLLLFPLLGVHSCTGKQAKLLPTNCDVSTTTCTVHIDTSNASCIAAKENPQDVPVGYTLIWAPPPPTTPLHVYSANFWSLKVPFTPSSSSSVTTVDGGVGVTVTGDSECRSSTTTGCYFPYVIFKDGTKKCSDPGVHVIPD